MLCQLGGQRCPCHCQARGVRNAPAPGLQLTSVKQQVDDLFESLHMQNVLLFHQYHESVAYPLLSASALCSRQGEAVLLC